MNPFTKRKKLVILIYLVTLFSEIVLLVSTWPDAEQAASEDILPTVSDESVYNFLLVGVDEAADLCDVIIIVSYDTKCGKIEALQIPRDTYASYTDAAYRKLNGAIHSLGSVERFGEFIESALCIPIDYHVVVDMQTISDVVDKLGGVEVYIESDMHYIDPYQELDIDLRAGLNRLNGDEAVDFLRFRSGYLRGDLGRLDAQKVFLASFVKKILQDSSIAEISSIALSLINKIQTDLSVSDCLYFISRIPEIKLENIAFMTMPGEDIQSESGAWYYIINREEAYNVIKNYFVTTLEEKDFDIKRCFTSIYRYGFNRIYDAKSTYKTERYTADEICRDGINID